MVEVCTSDRGTDTREAVEELLEHRMLTDEVTGSIAVPPKGDVDAGELIDNVIENNAVCPKCDTEANETNGKEVEIENDAVRPKCDIDAGETTDNKIEEYTVRPKNGH